ncbi:MAG TPA: dihydrofolate reductase family protein [Streptosporangiaceae bacterium]
MSKVVLSMTMSLDGVAGGELTEEGWAIHEQVLGWVFPIRSWRREQGQEGGEDSVDSRLWDEEFGRFGPQVIGRGMFDVGYQYWGDNPPFHAPVFVLTHRGQERVSKQGGTSYTFVTGGIEDAIRQASKVAGDKDVLVAGGISVARQALAAGLVDELVMHVAPVLIGHGGRTLFDVLDGQRLSLRSTAAVAGEGAVHLRYEVGRDGAA